MSKGGSRCWVRQVVGRHIDSLHRGDRSRLGRSNTFLHGTHLRSQCRLITYGRRHTAQQGRHLRTSLGETEDVIDKEQDISSTAIFTTGITETLCHSQSRQCYRGTCTGRFVHLSINQSSLALLQFFRINKTQIPFSLIHCLTELITIADNARLNHLSNQVITLTGTLTNASEYRKSVMTFGNVIDELHDEHGLTHTGTTEQSNLTTFQIRLQQVNHLNTSSQHLFRGRQFLELWSFTVNGVSPLHVKLFHTVNRLTDNVQHTTLNLFA